MGRVIPVSVFEESRSDFWCEAEVPGDLLAAPASASAGGGWEGAAPPCPVGLRVPKECIPLILDDGHPMRMQTILDDADLRHLSVLIADRLKLCSVGSARRGARSYHFWLDGALGGDHNQPAKRGDPAEGAGGGVAGVGTDAEQRDRDQAGREFKLSLRKRSVGQVVFSRLVSFWVPSSDEDDPSSGASETGGVRKALRGRNDGRPAVSSLPAAGNFVQRLVVIKEFSHRGECGELRGQTHDPESGGGSEAFVLAPELTRTLLGDWFRTSRGRSRNKSLPARYWRDALTWRLGIVQEPRVRSTSCHEQQQLQNVDRNDGAEGVQRAVITVTRTNEESGECRMTVDERTPLFSLHRVVARMGGTPSTGVDIGEDETIAQPAALFDLLVLPPRTESASPRRNEARIRIPAIELVATHRQTVAVFGFYIPTKAFLKGLDAVVAACLSTPTALSTELELTASDTALRDLAGSWLRYSPAGDQSGPGGDKVDRQPTLTLNFPGTKAVPIVAEPRVSLRCRCPAKNAPISLKPGVEPDGIVHSGVGTAAIAAGERRTSACQVAGIKQGSEEARGSMPRSKRRSSLGNIATLQVDTRNERMVFRRSVTVPRSRDDVDEGRRANDSPGRPGHREVEEEGSEGGAGAFSAKVLAVSVYEVFSAGPTERIRRHLRFCARDETVRPVVEASTAVPWAGTCEGVEGGKLWRVVTEGLSVGSVRDEKGTRLAGMRLHVSTDNVVEPDTIVDGSLQTAASEGRGSGAATAARFGGGCDEDTGRREMVVTEDPPLGGPGTSEVGGGARQSPNVPAEGILEGVQQELSAPEGGPTAPGEVFDKAYDPPGPRHQHEDDRPRTTNAIGPQPIQDESVSPMDCLHSRKPRPLGAGGKGGAAASVPGVEPRAARTGKLYSGWHRITGVWLHVQCFLEGERKTRGVHIHEPLDVDGHGFGNDDTGEGRPAGRGGTVGIPIPATLRFLLCDPTSGYRTAVDVSADDVRRNLSADGGSVQAGLLDAGRRPALAKAIAQKLRLVFDEGGGYRVVLPLPAEWNRRCREAG